MAALGTMGCMNIPLYKEKLEAELKLVEAELKTVGRKNPATPGDWEGTGGDIDQTATESDEIADRMEQYEENRAIADELEIRYTAIQHALDKIAEGKYGVCEIGGEPIEEARLDADPSARTCKAHMQSI